MSIHIPAEYFPLFRSAGHARALPADTDIFVQGDPASCIYLVTRGRVRAFAMSADGRETTLEVLTAGRIFGDSSFLSGIRRSVTIRTVTAAELVVCPTDRLVELCRGSAEVMVLLFQHMAETCNYLTHQVTRLVHYDSRQRVADFLLCESDSRGREELPYTHEEIAQSVSLNRVTVSRILSELKERGAVAGGYGSVRITDRAALRALLPEG